MKEYIYFKESGDPEITVALAGINRLDWMAVQEDASVEYCYTIMANSRFDVLPVVNKKGDLIGYYTTAVWGKYVQNQMGYFEIEQQDRLYFLTHIHDAIKKFAKTSRKFFFLDNQSDIVGLITIGNLNCKHMYVYLYNLIVQLEQSLGKYLLLKGVTDREIIQILEAKSDSDSAREVLRRYREDDAKGFDYKLIEYLYLTQLGDIFKKQKLHEAIGFSTKKFDVHVARINELRNTVAHPNKSIINNGRSIENLNEVIDRIDLLLDKLHI